MGLLGSLSYKNSTEFYKDAQNNFFNRSTNTTVYELDTNRAQKGDLGINNVIISGLLGVSYKTEKSKYKVNILHIQNGESKAGYFRQQTRFSDNIDLKSKDTNAMDAIGRGAADGMKLAANVAAMLIAFISIVAMVNFILGYANTSLQEILGMIFKPIAWSMGVPWEEANIVGTLMGEKIVLTELIAFGDLTNYIKNDLLSERSAIIASYALCGFANVGSIGIQLGGIGAMAPERRGDLSNLVFKAMIGGALASWLTASIAGILI